MSRNAQNQKKEPKYSVVVPVYNEVDNIKPLFQAIEEVMEKMTESYEIVMVDDGSTDGTTHSLRNLAGMKPKLKVVLFRGNFGQSAAMAAGFEQACGEIIISMDGDLQNDPRDIPLMVQKLDEGFDMVAGWRKNRKDHFFIRKIPSKIANRIICSVTDIQLHDVGCSLKIYRRHIIKKMRLYGELHRFIPSLAKIEGAKITEMAVNHHARKFGKSKYNLTRTFRVIMDLMSMNLFLRHLHNPGYFFGTIGLAFAALGLVFFSNAGYHFVFHRYSIDQLNILMTCVLLFFGSALQFIFLGLIAKLIVESGDYHDAGSEFVENLG